VDRSDLYYFLKSRKLTSEVTVRDYDGVEPPINKGAFAESLGRGLSMDINWTRRPYRPPDTEPPAFECANNLPVEWSRQRQMLGLIAQ
jgi:hypothetical protein